MLKSPLLKILVLYLGVHIVLLTWGALARRMDQRLRYTVLDVGQGDGTVMETPAGHVMVVDTGGITEEGIDRGGPILTAFLRSRGINRIDAMVLTHPHADHIGGAAMLLQRFPVGLLMDDGVDESGPLMSQIRAVARERGTQYKLARRGETLAFDDGVRVQVLAPGPELLPGGANNESVTLRATYGRATMLLTGDAEAPEEDAVLASGLPVSCDVLKVGHHGSHTSSSPALLKAAHPRIAIISVGEHNRYGHPSPEIPTRLAWFGAQVYRTDANGAVVCVTNGQSNIDVSPTVEGADDAPRR